jgi:hypothetical protein
VFRKRGESVPFAMPDIVMGIDTTEMSRLFYEHSRAVFRGENPAPFSSDSEEMNKHLKRRP